jgi:glutaredoxin
MRVRVTLYTRRGCHLCDDAKAAILLADCGVAYELDEVDVDADPALRARYTNDVPVVAIDGAEVFWHHVDPAELAREVRRAAAQYVRELTDATDSGA